MLNFVDIKHILEIVKENLFNSKSKCVIRNRTFRRAINNALQKLKFIQILNPKMSVACQKVQVKWKN